MSATGSERPSPLPCVTCYGEGQIVTEQGSLTCPDCLGQGHPPARGVHMEWRLRDMERALPGPTPGGEGDIRWLIFELRRNRNALLQILARCQDADESDRTAAEVKYLANEALEMYEKIAAR